MTVLTGEYCEFCSANSRFSVGEEGLCLVQRGVGDDRSRGMVFEIGRNRYRLTCKNTKRKRSYAFLPYAIFPRPHETVAWNTKPRPQQYSPSLMLGRKLRFKLRLSPGQYPRRSVRALIEMGPEVHSQQHNVFSTLFSTGI